MSEDRTKPPPGRRWCCDKEHDERFISGYPSRPSLARAWADHDLVQAAAERRGYMLAIERLQATSDDPKAPLDDMQRDGVLWALIELQCQAPGEAE